MAITYAAGTNSPSNLWQMVQDYTSNTETSFVAYIPSFVKLAEERIYNTVEIPTLRKTTNLTLTLGTPTLALPSDYTAAFSLAITQTDGSGNSYKTFLLDKDVEYIRQAFPYPSPSSYYGPPTHYAVISGATLLVGPTPDLAYPLELQYYAYPESITTAGSTWVGNYASNCLLYGTLREAYLYMKGEEDMVKYYEDKYQEGVALLKNLAEGRGRRDTYRSGQVRTSEQ
jgi:hypothetical protein